MFSSEGQSSLFKALVEKSLVVLGQILSISRVNSILFGFGNNDRPQQFHKLNNSTGRCELLSNIP